MKDARNRKVHLGNNSSELSPSVLVSRKTPSPKINKTSPENLLLTNREFLKSVLDHIDALVYVTDMETYEVLYINKYGGKRKSSDQSLKMSLAKLRKATNGIINVIIMAVEMRDPYTAGHQKRLANLARSIAKEMGLTDDNIDCIRMAGIIHDLGNISIPAEILTQDRAN